MLQKSKQLSDTHSLNEALALLEGEAQALFAEDLATCRAIGAHGAALFGGKSRPLQVMTHCNTGSLATAGYGTALGVIRALHEAGKVGHVYAGETRPWLQGARLTAYELQKEGIPYTVLADGAAAALLASAKPSIDAIIVGADRIAANGDTANKIGTYSLAVLARYHQVPFYIAAPMATIDMQLRDGSAIPIENRPPEEVTHFAGRPVAPTGAKAFNPSFDVTPHTLIGGYITELGVLTPNLFPG